jgi:hypothetical protein
MSSTKQTIHNGMTIESGFTIEQIHEHLKAGNEVTLVTYTRTTVLDSRHVDYIRADGNGFRLGWPGKKSVYAFANQIKLVPPGMTMKGARK